MVQLCLTTSESGLKEWSLVELQGDLECKDADLSEKLIGDLHYTKQSVPVLIIGHHILYGKVAKLEKPFIVLKRSTGATKAYNAISVIKTKVVFKTRPKPIISDVLTKL